MFRLLVTTSAFVLASTFSVVARATEQETIELHVQGTCFAGVVAGVGVANIVAVAEDAEPTPFVIVGYVAGVASIALGTTAVLLADEAPSVERAEAVRGWGFAFLGIGSTTVLLSILHQASSTDLTASAAPPKMAGATMGFVVPW